MSDRLSGRSSDRNLLFGILALQMDFISRDQLVAAMHAWVQAKEKSLGQVLREQNALPTDACALLEAMVQKHVELHGDEPERSLAAVSSASSVREQLTQITDVEVQGSVAQLSTTRTDDDPRATPAPSVGTPTSSGLRFRILRPHARGGLGQVSVAHDEELGREVALKEIQERYADHPASRSRFLLEAEVTGRLEHPGVVPVYGLGRYADGRPFYAMRFIRGDSLQDAIDRFHRADTPGRDPGERSLALRQLLGRLLDVCHAVAYAHSRGVLHRDLKPANVMLGRFGETLVVDWGLAKADGRIVPTAGDADTEPPLVPTSGSGAEATRAGQAIGTPAYMSPEQAAGRLDQLGPASDVYSLGATLYYLLTGRPPFTASDLGKLLRDVQEGAVPPPRLVKPGLPPALEAVCLKAMARRPEDRYPSARALADDLEHWLADEPVTAYREPLRLRLRRWGRRHRTLVTGAVTLLVTAVVGLAAGLWALHAEQRRTLEERDRAEANLGLARTAVDRCFVVVTEDPLLQQDSMRRVRKLLLEQALPFYRDFQARRADDPGLRHELARNYHRVGVITAEVGRQAEALEAFQTSLAYREALAAEHPEDDTYQEDLGRTLIDLGWVQHNRGQEVDAAERYRRAIAILEGVLAAGRGSDTTREELARAYLDQGTLQRQRRQLQDALRSIDRARTLREGLVASHPGEARYQSQLTAAVYNYSVIQGDLGQTVAARATMEQARVVLAELAAKYPAITDYQLTLAKACFSLGNFAREAGDFPAARRWFEQARSLRERLTVAHPDVPAYQAQLADALNNLGALYSELNELDESRKAFEAACSIFERLVAAQPEIVDYQDSLGRGRSNVGYVLGRLEQWDAALVAYHQAHDIRLKLAEAYPENSDFQIDLAWTQFSLGNALRDTGKVAESFTWYERSLRRLEDVCRKEPNYSWGREALSHAHWSRATAYTRLGRHAEARRDWDRALALAPAPVRDRLRRERAAALAAAGDHAAAVAEARALTPGETPPAGVLYDLACVWSLAAAAVGKDGRLASAERDRRAEEDAVTALAALRRAQAAGYFKDPNRVRHLKKDTALDPLRGRADFRRFVGDVEQTGAPKGS